MKPEAIKKVFARRPFRPLELVLDNGERFVVAHPELVLLGKTMIALMPVGATDPEIIAPEAVSSIHAVRAKGRT